MLLVVLILHVAVDATPLLLEEDKLRGGKVKVEQMA